MKTETRVNGPWSDRKIYMGQDLPQELYPWQEEVRDRCMAEADDRTINYIYDPVGNTGKSKFAKYMAYHHKALMLPWGKTGDLLNLVVKRTGTEIFFFDLSRSKPQDWAKDDIAAAAEQIKNGHIVNLKYETGDTMFNPPHVWMFSNQLPNLASVSYDRWAIWKIVHPGRNLERVSLRRIQEECGRSNRVRDSSPHRPITILE